MILVMLGTNPYPFHRLLSAMSDYGQKHDERIVAQSGNTPEYPYVECYPFLEHSALVDLIDQADVVVCQGGYGSINDCLKRGARIVAVPRSIEFGECVDNQRELVEALEAEGLVIPAYQVADIEMMIESARKLSPKAEDSLSLPLHVSKIIAQMLGRDG